MGEELQSICKEKGKFVRKRKEKEKYVKKCEKCSKQVRISSQVLVVEERVQKVVFGPKYCVILPIVCQSLWLHSKGSSKCHIHCLLAIALRTFVFLTFLC